MLYKFSFLRSSIYFIKMKYMVWPIFLFFKIQFSKDIVSPDRQKALQVNNLKSRILYKVT